VTATSHPGMLGIWRGTSPEQQPDGLDQNRLAGAGLPRQDVEAIVELDLDSLDHRQVTDSKEAEHASGTAIVSYI